MDTTASERSEKVIMNKIITNLPDNNDKDYTENNRETGAFTIKEDPDKDKKTRYIKLCLA